MSAYLAKRSAVMVLTVIGIVSVVFLMIRALPGDPVVFLLGDEGAVGAEAIEKIREKLGLTDSLQAQYARYVVKTLRFDLGESLLSGVPVTELLSNALPITIVVAMASVVLSVLIAVPFGAMAAYRRTQGRDSLDQGLTWFAIVTDALPGFWIALVLLLIFSLQLGWFPVSGAIHWNEPLQVTKRFLLPVIVLGIAQLASVARVTRTAVLEALQEDYVRTARSLGTPELAIVFRHALRNSLLPVVTVLGLSFGRLLGGTIITENVFSIPGMGTLLVQGIQGRDYTVAQGVILIYAFLFIVVNLVTDLLYTRLDPRVKLEA